jgi:hypothetical protein
MCGEFVLLLEVIGEAVRHFHRRHEGASEWITYLEIVLTATLYLAGIAR